MLDKVKRTSAYDIIQNTFVQAIRKIHFPFSYSPPEITIVWKFDGRRRFFQVKISCENMMGAHNSLDSALGVPVMCLLDWIEVCNIADYITCLKYISVFLKFVRRSVSLYSIISMCFVFVCHNFYIPVFQHSPYFPL